jgi:hypothetical protein
MADFDVSDSPFMALYPEVEPLLKPDIEAVSLPQSDAPDASESTPTPNALAPPPLAIYPSKEALFEAIQSWSKAHGYAFTVGRSTRLKSRRQRVTYACDRCPPVRPPVQGICNTIRRTQTRGSGCLFSILAVELSDSLGWELRYRPEARYNTHNHPPSQSPAVHPSYHHLSTQAQSIAQNLFSVGKYIVISIKL